MGFLARARRLILRKVFGLDFAQTFQSHYNALDYLSGQINELRAEVGELRGREFAKAALLRAQKDATEDARARLEEFRASARYPSAFAPRPLVSIRIASYRKTEELIEVALASVARQTYDNYEVVVVNDGPNERTRDALATLAMPNLRYVELPRRSEYPEHPRLRWMVAGAPGMNLAATLARGEWVAPLDDDDEFTPDHLEKLVNLALESRAELVYGAARQINEVNGTTVDIWSDPPQMSHFGFAGAMYMQGLNDIFQYDIESWLVNEPGDWNLARRMLAAGVTYASTTDVLATSHQVPYTHKNASTS